MPLQITTVNGSEESRWRWFEMPSGDGFAVELYGPTASQLAKVGQQFRISSDREDTDGFRAYIAKRWFRDFRGAVDAQGAPITNRVEMREAILNDPGVWLFVLQMLGNFSAWREEGNAVGASA